MNSTSSTTTRAAFCKYFKRRLLAPEISAVFSTDISPESVSNATAYPRLSPQHSQRRCEMRFANAGRPREADVVSLLHPSHITTSRSICSRVTLRWKPKSNVSNRLFSGECGSLAAQRGFFSIRSRCSSIRNSSTLSNVSGSYQHIRHQNQLAGYGGRDRRFSTRSCGVNIILPPTLA